ncbi:MAG: DegT/DnrJ/EryC1/StrS family aminotransferase [Chitinophagales bacterium]|nr:DegT/DnrJ/EryC1/StrS family aminotransferase [Chitinophagales bacterium]
MIPFVDLEYIHTPLQADFRKVQETCINTSDFVTTGQMVKNFENAFAQYCEVKYCVGVSSGTAALFLTLKAMGIQEGDEVIVPSHTFIATAMAVSHCGAKPVFVDVDSETWNIRWSDIQPKVNEKTKAIIAVHIYGNPVDLEEIVTNAHALSIPVIEDACQAHGAIYQGKKVGSLADAACFSFYPSKNLGALGEGGAITTNNEELTQKILKLRNYGRSDKYKHDFVGYNLRLQAIQAGFLSVKLPFLDGWNQERRRLVSVYRHFLKDTDYQLQKVVTNAQSVYHLCVIKCKNRENVIQHFTKNEIGFGVHYPLTCHQQPAYPDDFNLSLQISEHLTQSVISLPLYVGLKDEQVERVCRILQKV